MVVNPTWFPSPVPVVNLFHLCEHEFYFTGSRWMGDWHDDSDWDFIAADTLVVWNYLESLGFKEKDFKEEYGDGATSRIVELVTPEGKVQVQLCRNPARKHRCAETIRTEHREANRTLRGRERIEFWAAVYQRTP